MSSGEPMTNHSAGRSEPSAPSRGSVGEPLAFAVMQPDSYVVVHSLHSAFAMRDMCAGGEVVPLYRQPQDRVVRLPRLLWDSSEKMGKGEWDYQQRVKTALEVAGVKWVEIE